MSRTAHCCCGALRAAVSGEPALVVACHCEQCQRRTGTAFGVSAYFPADQVRITGPSKVFSRESQAGRKVEMHFCPECGTTVFWEAAFMPGHVGIAAGAFSDEEPSRLRCELKRLGIHQRVIEDEIRFLETLDGSERQQFRIARAGTYQGDSARHFTSSG